MTDATIASPADLNRANIAKTAADATATLQQMTKDFQSSPDYRVEQLEREIDQLARAEGNGAAVRRATLQSELTTAKTEQKAQSVVLTDEQRVDLAMANKLDFNGAQTTIGDQVHAKDFVGAIQDDLALGVPEDVVRSYYATGTSGRPLAHVDGQYWLDRYAADPEMQARLAAGDPVMKMRMNLAIKCVAGKCGDATPAEEAARRNWLASSPRQGR